MATLKGNQQKIFDFIKSKNGDLTGFSLRDIGEEAGVGKKAQIVSHHLNQLEKMGYLRRLKKKELVFAVLKKPVEDVVMVKRFQFAQCGPEGLLGDDNVVGEVPLPSQPFGISKADEYFLIDTKGDSMKPMIEEGDLVLARVVHSPSEADSGDIVVVVHNEVPKIKRLFKTGQGENVVCGLESLNSAFRTESVEMGDDFRIVGKVKSIIKNYV